MNEQQAHDAEGIAPEPVLARISFADGGPVDLAEQHGAFPHPIQRLVLPIVAMDGMVATPLGTGFLIGPHLVVTARHVIEDELERLQAGKASLHCLYLTDQVLPDHEGPWGGLLAVRHLSMAEDRSVHDVALLTIDFPYLPDGTAARPNALPLSFKVPDEGTSLLVLGYSEMVDSFIPGNGDVPAVLSHDQRVRASQGVVIQLHVPQRDAAMLSYPVLESDHVSLHGMSGGPVIAADGTVRAVVCSAWEFTEDGPPTSYASLLGPLLGLSADPSLSDPPNLRTLYELIESGDLPSDGSHRHVIGKA